MRGDLKSIFQKNIGILPCLLVNIFKGPKNFERQNIAYPRACHVWYNTLSQLLFVHHCIYIIWIVFVCWYNCNGELLIKRTWMTAILIIAVYHFILTSYQKDGILEHTTKGPYFSSKGIPISEREWYKCQFLLRSCATAHFRAS